MKTMIYSSTILLVVLLTLIVLGCSESNRQPLGKATPQVPDFPVSLAGLTRFYFGIIYLPESQQPYIYDRYYFYHKHRDEILGTLNVKDSIFTKNIAIVFLTYRIDTTSYNDVLWFRSLDGKWWIAYLQYFSEYADDPFGDGLPAGAKEIIKRADNWKKQNKGMWWG